MIAGTNHILLIFILLITSCIEPFSLDNINSEGVLVFEGMISNDPGPYEFLLSKTTTIDYPKHIPYSDANIFIKDDLGFEETLTQTEAGVYITDSLGIRGIVGRKYKVVIETFDGKTYESDFSELKEPIPINELYCEYETTHDYVTGNDTEGYRFYSDFQPFVDKETYMMWLSIETFEREVPFTIDYLWVGYLQPFEHPDTFKVCWNTRPVSDIITLVNYPERNIQALSMPLNHSILRKFHIKYSLLLKQLTVDKGTYQYWQAYNDLNEGQGSFYNQQPYQLKGNIHNIENENETILGYFFAAGKTEKRIFHSHSSTDPDFCHPDFDSMRFLQYLPARYWPVMIVDLGDGALAQGDDACFDCRIKGGSTEKPDFWED